MLDEKGKIRMHIHKLNNLITVIQGNAQLIKLGQDNKEDAEEILIACSQMSDALKAIRQIVAEQVEFNE